MNTEIRRYIINNFQGDNFETLKRAIDESVKEKDQYNLHGLGVFLELIWENASTEIKNELIEIIRKRVKKGLANDES